MDRNLVIQYTIVGIILLATGAWLVIKLFCKKKRNSGCCGCAISEKCSRSQAPKGKK